MMKKITLNGQTYDILQNEFAEFIYKGYENLKLYPELGILEREVGLINDINSVFIKKMNVINFVNIGLSHGCYVPLNVKNYSYVCALNVNGYTNNHIKEIKSLIDLDDTILSVIKSDSENVLYNFAPTSNRIIMTYADVIAPNHKMYRLSNSKMLIYIPINLDDIFKSEFWCYLDGSTLNYDNMINLCIMVKNAGDGFKNILEQNLQYIDKWTILDTGSTDNTVQIIKDVLKNKKGNLYQEPFINFRDSRNRLLDLAGNDCKYTIMLDDTYILTGNVREFLKLIRSDQFGNSYNVFIKSHDTTYGSNRILKTENKIRYEIHRIHEIPSTKNNKVIQIPMNQILINDVDSEYMRIRTKNRKLSDLNLLFETLNEYPDIPRTLMYIAQTYAGLEMWNEAFEYSMKRINHPIKGYVEEITECYLICAEIAHHVFKWDTEECEKLYLKCLENDPTKPDSLYCLGKYFLNIDKLKSYGYFKKAFEIGFPSINTTSNLRYNIYETLVPYNLATLCYELDDSELGEKAVTRYLEKNKQDELMNIYKNIFTLLNYDKMIAKQQLKTNHKILCFVAPGGFKQWNAKSLEKDGVGGSETYIIEMAKHIANITDFKVYVFCETPKEKKYGKVCYKTIGKYVNFLNKYKIHTCIISRYAEYLPVTYKHDVNNIYVVVHDLCLTANMLPLNDKLKYIFCMSEWHKEYFTKSFPMVANKIKVFPNGINVNKYHSCNKKKNAFIYSSFADRGLLNLLKMFPKIKKILPDATLDVFCDTKNNFVQTFHKNDMDLIEKLLQDQQDYVVNHGWVKKDVLIEYFKRADYWLYPCTFAETFCVTALEIAASNIVALSNNLAALNETVGERGIIVPGDANTTEWQDQMINEILKISLDNTKRNELLSLNKKWSEQYDWKILAKIFVEKYLQ